MGFSKLNLSKKLQTLLEKNSFNSPTLIQEKVIPLILKDNDIIASSQTGSGKSASFVLPILEKLNNDEREGKAKIES